GWELYCTDDSAEVAKLFGICDPLHLSERTPMEKPDRRSLLPGVRDAGTPPAVVIDSRAVIARARRRAAVRDVLDLVLLLCDDDRNPEHAFLGMRLASRERRQFHLARRLRQKARRNQRDVVVRRRDRRAVQQRERTAGRGEAKGVAGENDPGRDDRQRRVVAV